MRRATISLGSSSDDSAAMRKLNAGCEGHRGETNALTDELQQRTTNKRREATIDDDNFGMINLYFFGASVYGMAVVDFGVVLFTYGTSR